ncbi:IclR family transcriptional regulator [Limnochorda pilosa]|uniref:IclR family transcriptional regulator n=1 Tax=Limnochorda pilosa TaxID=1555112 RepID=UPI0026EDD16B|nr:IclR family transcriptional regulator [Limnochorda pilosa]
MARSRNQASSGAVGVPRVQAVQSAARILWTVGHSGARGMTLNQLAQAVEVPKSTVLRIAQTLVDEGLLEREESTGLFRLGIRTLELASMVHETLEIPRVARPHLEWLSEQTRETVHLCVLDEGEVVYVDKIESPQAIRLYSRIGRRAPAHCTGVGKALMAFLPSTERRRLVEKRPLKRFTPNTITDFFQLEKELEQIRQTGIAYDREEHEPGVRCAAAPVFDLTGRVCAAVSVAVPILRLPPGRLEELAGLVKQATQAISEALGYRAHAKRLAGSRLDVRPGP